jgi:PAS domain S-box-containing protein
MTKQSDMLRSGREKMRLRVLLLGDSPGDAGLLINHLESDGYQIDHQNVCNIPALEKALEKGPWDVVLCDNTLPGFSPVTAISLLKGRKLDWPFIVVSGQAGGKMAAEVMQAGAHDFITKDDLSRLGPVIERELREARIRAQWTSDLQKLLYLIAIVDSMGEAIISYDPDGIITTWNTGAEQLFGYARAEAVGKSIFILVPDTLRASAAEMLEGLRHGKPAEPLETTRLRRDGTPVNVYSTVSAIKDADGSMIGFASLSYDITERKKLEEERTRMIDELHQTMSKVKTLSGLLPICASCKKIRDDKGYWQRLETFVKEHSNAEFSHSICPDCLKKLYPDFIEPTE